MQTQQSDPITTLELAPIQAKGEIAKYAWDALPVERRTRDNLQVLRDAALTNPQGFVEVCRQEGLPINLSLVVNHHETHHHHPAQPAQPPSPPGLTAADVAAIVQANQQPGLTAADIAAIVAACQQQPQQPVVVQQGYSQDDLMAMASYAALAAQYEPTYYPPLVQEVYQPAPSFEAPQIHFEPHIEVYAGGGHSSSRSEATSHSEQDNRGGGLAFVALAIALMLFGVGVGANQ